MFILSIYIIFTCIMLPLLLHFLILNKRSKVYSVGVHVYSRCVPYNFAFLMCLRISLFQIGIYWKANKQDIYYAVFRLFSLVFC
jgi:hypothetical protein